MSLWHCYILKGNHLDAHKNKRSGHEADAREEKNEQRFQCSGRDRTRFHQWSQLRAGRSGQGRPELRHDPELQEAWHLLPSAHPVPECSAEGTQGRQVRR